MGRQQELRDGLVMLVHRVAQRGPAKGVHGIYVRAFGEQQFDQASVTGSGRQMQRSLVGTDSVLQVFRIQAAHFPGGGIHGRAGGQEGLDDLLVTLPRGEMQGRDAASVLGAGLGALAQQQVNDGFVAVGRGVVQRGQAGLLEAVHRPAVQQQLHHG